MAELQIDSEARLKHVTDLIFEKVSNSCIVCVFCCRNRKWKLLIKWKWLLELYVLSLYLHIEIANKLSVIFIKEIKIQYWIFVHKSMMYTNDALIMVHLLINLFFQAISEPGFSVAYASMCRYLTQVCTDLLKLVQQKYCTSILEVSF